MLDATLTVLEADYRTPLNAVSVSVALMATSRL